MEKYLSNMLWHAQRVSKQFVQSCTTNYPANHRMECNNVPPQYFWSARDHVWETYPRHNAPKQPHIVGCVKFARPLQDLLQAMQQLPGDCNPSKKPVHNPTTPPKFLGPHRTIRPLSAQYWGLGEKATCQPNVDQSLSLHPRSLPAMPHIRNNHFDAKWVHPR